ncbi:1-acyl-sn-glycerol-3-phosphate acyltransferase [Oligoflexia bacterium]|nr:1-acyl-sn-glycerol-3-phosphate acyltransferase [Oligoflexia bacterium]
MQKFLGWIFTPLLGLAFTFVLGVFHPIQMLAFRFGYTPHKKVVDCMCFCLVVALKLVGTKIRFHSTYTLPTERPIIFVSNHQSMFDIPMISWFLRDNHPKFISKQELGQGVPSVSYNLRHGGSILIDRSNPRQALPEIDRLGKYITKYHRAACIYPEGTRARDGVLKKFKTSGFLKLKKTAPAALIVPLVIQGSWELLRYKLKPVPFGATFSLTVLEPIEQAALSGRDILELAESNIRKVLEQPSQGEPIASTPKQAHL